MTVTKTSVYSYKRSPGQPPRVGEEESGEANTGLVWRSFQARRSFNLSGEPSWL